ncbi:MAG: hypothetical protein R6X15_10740 [Pseudomonadota bacterium]
MSQDFAKEKDIDPACLANRAAAPVSHDNLFHSLLGLYDIQTALYDRELDVFSSCRGAYDSPSQSLTLHTDRDGGASAHN